MNSLTKISKREEILKILENKNNWVSGEQIANSLSLSRMAVAKHIASLREQGHAIEAATRRGYRLILKTDPIRVEDIRDHLSTKILGQKEWLYLDKTDSTNRQATVWAAQGIDEGSIVISERQTDGRGRKQRKWFSSPRSLQFSVILRPSLPTEKLPDLMRIGALAVTEAISALTNLNPVIKDPNDIYINSRKVCGILFELGFKEQDLEWVVMGIGCNVNALEQDFCDELKSIATSLYIEGEQPVSRSVLLIKIMEYLENGYLRFCRGDTL